MIHMYFKVLDVQLFPIVIFTDRVRLIQTIEFVLNKLLQMNFNIFATGRLERSRC